MDIELRLILGQVQLFYRTLYTYTKLSTPCKFYCFFSCFSKTSLRNISPACKRSPALFAFPNSRAYSFNFDISAAGAFMILALFFFDISHYAADSHAISRPKTPCDPNSFSAAQVSPSKQFSKFLRFLPCNLNSFY